MNALVSALLVALCASGVDGARTAVAAGQTNNASLQDLLAQAERDSGVTGLKTLKYGLAPIDAVHFGLGVAEKMAWLGPLALPVEVLGPIAAEGMVVVEIAGAHAEAINELLNDQILSGFSRGVVLGADQRPGSYVKSNFVKFSPVPNTVYPEYGKRFQNAYNQALIAGYAQGKSLTDAERKAFFVDLFSRMSVKPAVTYGEDSKLWRDKTWIDYYIECASVFRRDHLK